MIATTTLRLRFICAVTALAGLGSCAVNPVTGDRELALISEQQEVAMGAQAAEQVKVSMGLVDDPGLQQYVSDLGLALARDSERPNLPWEFHVVDDPTPNAFALPGGFIFVTRGLMTLLGSEAELVAVLGHEIGHVTARHSVSQMSRAQLAQIGLGIGAIASPETFGQFGDLANQGLSLLFLRFGRDDERQADELGFRYMLAENYDVREMPDVFASLDAASQLAGASPIPGWFASHPSGPERVAAAQERIAALPPQQIPDRVNTAAYLNQVDGMVYGPDPRQGYFDGDRFYHPELAFEFIVPSAWQRQNMTSAVVAVNPDRNMAMQLTIAPGDNEQSAAANFFSESGLQQIGSQRTDINGQSAMLSEFGAQTQNGNLHGLVAHIEFGALVYQIVVYGPEQAFAANLDTARLILGSFDAVTDREVLNVQANRVQVVDVPGSMSLADFNERWPSVVSLEELAVINQLPGTNASVSGRAKRIIG